jgi:ABC-type branched-subunit amino acid transport system permease subunit
MFQLFRFQNRSSGYVSNFLSHLILTVPVSDSYDERGSTSLDMVFIIVPAVVGVAVIAAVIIGVVAIRRRGIPTSVMKYYNQM